MPATKNDEPKGGADAGSTIEPISVRISTAVKLTGIGRSRIYELIQSGEIEAVKVGGSTLIPFRSLKHLIEGGAPLI